MRSGSELELRETDLPSVIRKDFSLRLSSRIGVWGVLTGIAGSVARDLGLAIPYWFLGPVGGIGFFVGGLGVTAASAIVLRKTQRSLRTLRLGVIVGLPFGLLLSARAVLYLWFPGWAMDHLHVYSLLLTGAFGFGVALVILFIIGLIKHATRADGSEAEYA